MLFAVHLSELPMNVDLGLAPYLKHVGPNDIAAIG